MVNRRKTAPTPTVAKDRPARSGVLWVLVGKFSMDLLKAPGLIACCLFPVLFIFLCKIIVAGAPDHEFALSYLLTFSLLFATGMVPGTATVYPMSEAREKHTLRTLMLADVDSTQMVVARGIVAETASVLVGAACYLVSGAPLENLAAFVAVTALASAPMTALSLLLGLTARNQMAANFLSLPIVLIGVAPMLFIASETLHRALPLLPTGGGIALVDLLASGTLLSPAAIVPLAASFAWIVASIVALALLAARLAPTDQ